MKIEAIAEFLLSIEDLTPMDACFIGVIDFKTSSFETVKFQSHLDQEESALSLFVNDQPFKKTFLKHPSHIYFDLASLTKPLVNGLTYSLASEAFDEKMILCLNHQGGLPSWGLLSKLNWKKQILSYPISKAPTLYSDFSALRVMLELEKKNIHPKKLCSSVWDREIVEQKDIPERASLLQYGFRHGLPNIGKVHDPNAYIIQDFCSHAGLFGTLEGVCRTMIHWNQQCDFISQVSQRLTNHQSRFCLGWDKVEDIHHTIAGSHCGSKTFGHLGFTGTSFWVDPDQLRGHVILTNATKYHWFDKKKLNFIRREVGKIVWS